MDGSIAWVVNNVTLFETTLTWLPTQENASVSNGSLASSRIINWARSPNARFVIVFICPIETKYETLELFKRAVEEFLKVSSSRVFVETNEEHNPLTRFACRCDLVNGWP